MYGSFGSVVRHLWPFHKYTREPTAVQAHHRHVHLPTTCKFLLICIQATECLLDRVSDAEISCNTFEFKRVWREVGVPAGVNTSSQLYKNGGESAAARAPRYRRQCWQLRWGTSPLAKLTTAGRAPQHVQPQPPRRRCASCAYAEWARHAHRKNSIRSRQSSSAQTLQIEQGITQLNAGRRN